MGLLFSSTKKAMEIQGEMRLTSTHGPQAINQAHAPFPSRHQPFQSHSAFPPLSHAQMVGSHISAPTKPAKVSKIPQWRNSTGRIPDMGTLSLPNSHLRLTRKVDEPFPMLQYKFHNERAYPALLLPLYPFLPSFKQVGTNRIGTSAYAHRSWGHVKQCK